MRILELVRVAVYEIPKKKAQMQRRRQLEVIQLIRLRSIEVRQSQAESQQKRKLLTLARRYFTKKPVKHRPVPYQSREKERRKVVRFQNYYQVYNQCCVTNEALILYMKKPMSIATTALRVQKIQMSRFFYTNKSSRQVFTLANPLLFKYLSLLSYFTYGQGSIQNNTILSILIGAIIMKYSNPLQFLKIYTDRRNPVTDEMLLIPYDSPQNPLTFYYDAMRPIYEFCATQMLPAAQPHRTEVVTTTRTRIY